jgi:glycosyltransferase involved in cell wall biosynthesis
MDFSLIITTYNSPEYLLLVLRSAENQTILPNEVIIADDGSTSDTRKKIEFYKNKTHLKIIHSWQKDKGFRAAKSRNKALAKSKYDYIVMIDGDTILHPRFCEDHLNNSEYGFFIQGKRVFLSKNKSKQVLSSNKVNFSFFSFGFLNRINGLHSIILSSLFTNKNTNLRGIKTCNMSFFRQDCIDINGFNNEFEGWGKEDSEFIVRLFNNGIKRKNLRFSAVQFHLWHKVSSRESLKKNISLLNASITRKSNWCDDGISQEL